jgi:hypothetical protein
VAPTLTDLVVHDDPAPWIAAGLASPVSLTAPDASGTGACSRLGDVRLHVVPAAGGAATGLASLVLDGVPLHLDGLPAAAVPVPGVAAWAPPPLGPLRVDHVVVVTPDLDRTIAACEAAGLPLRRVRDAGPDPGGRPTRQAFFRLSDLAGGGPILEVVGPLEADPARRDAPAAFFGLACTTDDLDAVVAALGPDRCGPPRPAVQPGRRIATIRRGAGLAVAVALLSEPPGAAQHRS